jgi:hypothetical protein
MTTIDDMKDIIELTRVGRIAFNEGKEYMNDFIESINEDPIGKLLFADSALADGFDDNKMAEFLMMFFNAVIAELHRNDDNDLLDVKQLMADTIKISMIDPDDLDETAKGYKRGENPSNDSDEEDCENCPLQPLCDRLKNIDDDAGCK